jgi:hypothetical protein
LLGVRTKQHYTAWGRKLTIDKCGNSCCFASRVSVATKKDQKELGADISGRRIAGGLPRWTVSIRRPAEFHERLRAESGAILV